MFCRRIKDDEVCLRSHAAVAFEDAYPVSDGHMLVVPRRHVSSLFELERDDYLSVWDLVGTVSALVAADCAPDGFNIGMNVGAVAGQTVEHAHVHVIPRYEGDVLDPRGGVRSVMGAHAASWEQGG